MYPQTATINTAHKIPILVPSSNEYLIPKMELSLNANRSANMNINATKPKPTVKKIR